MKKKKINGAGLVVISNDLKKVLTLWKGGILDLPKGSIEKGETSMQTAFREASEEANISVGDCHLISNMPCTFDNMDFYYVFWDGTPSIKKNPQTGIFEHDDIKWVTWRKALDASPQFLKGALFHGLALTTILPRNKRK
jgi:8-oxo-dGTP pyrophosphatase MutT (NUDIX family)